MTAPSRPTRRAFLMAALGIGGIGSAAALVRRGRSERGGGGGGGGDGGGAGTSGVGADHPSVPAPVPARRTERIAIVGAGVAGLAAAAELRARGFGNIVVLEARTRIGGRVWTDTIGDGIPIDLGASWIHGVDGNPISAIARANGIATRPTDWDNDVIHYHGVGEPSRAARRMLRNFWQLAGEYPDRSLQSVHDEILAAGSFGEDDRHYIAYLLNSEVEHEYAADLADLSYESVDGARAFRGEDVVFPGGYRQIVDALASGAGVAGVAGLASGAEVGSDVGVNGGVEVRLGQAVTGIDHTESAVVLGTADGAIIEADRVVVTVPLGVLKGDLIAFRPSLPARKVDAIASLEMGVFNKTCLLFDDVFWDGDVEAVRYVSADTGQWTEALNLHAYTGQPILMMFNAGTHGARIERLSDREVVGQAVAALANMYGDVPSPTDARVTRWLRDPWTRGSYSFVPAGASFNSYATLAEPVGARVFFAGEATSEDYPATVHGAFLSGARAAREVAALSAAP